MQDHTPYFPDNITDYAPWVAKHGLLQPYGKCQCGCGEDTPIARLTDNFKRGTKKGLPTRYIFGHGSRLPVEYAFWRMVNKRGPDECWEWQGDTYGTGYGRLTHDSKTIRVHQFSYKLHIGPIPNGMFVCHKCDHPACVNPNHLFLGTPKDNMDDMIQKGRKVTKPGDTNAFAKLANSDIPKIRKLSQDGLSNQQIAERFHVSRSTISMIVNGKTWKSVP